MFQVEGKVACTKDTNQIHMTCNSQIMKVGMRYSSNQLDAFSKGRKIPQSFFKAAAARRNVVLLIGRVMKTFLKSPSLPHSISSFPSSSVGDDLVALSSYSPIPHGMHGCENMFTAARHFLRCDRESTLPR